MAMRTSLAGQDFIRRAEGQGGAPVLKAYADPGGVWTIGFGTIRYADGAPVKAGDSCTAVEAEAWFVQALTVPENAINHLVQVALTQPQFDALASFIYNEGEGNFAGSTLLKLLNQGRFRDAAAQFGQWTKVRVNGVLMPCAGLAARRAAERDLFLSGTADGTGTVT